MEGIKNIVYQYYPKGIDSFSCKEQYKNSNEYKRLTGKLKSSSSYKELSSYKNLLERLQNNKAIYNFEDVSLLNWEDRCITLEINFIDDKVLNKICINISFLASYYTIYLLENEIELNPYKWKTIPKRNRDKEKTSFKNYIKMFSKIVEEEFMFTKMEDHLLAQVIEDISFQDISFGEFNLFNALFINENKFL